MKAQIIKYKCCGKVFAACVEPHCYTDKDWTKDLRKYVMEGHTVEVIESDGFKFESCECKEIKPIEEIEDPNQIKLTL